MRGDQLAREWRILRTLESDKYGITLADLTEQKKRNMADYYQENHKAYYEATSSVDPSSFLEPFARHLFKNALVLDVGCGSGRDLLWLKKRGFRVIGFERSEGLAELAGGSAGCEVINGDFETYDFSGMSVDAILMSGSFVHLPHDKLADVFRNVTRAGAVVPNSGFGFHVYVSLKEGVGARADSSGRTFYLWRDNDLRKLFRIQGFSIVDFIRSESVLGTGEVWLGYVLVK